MLRAMDNAYRLLNSPERKAFDLSLEPKDSYDDATTRAASAWAACSPGGWSRPGRGSSK